MSTLVKNANEIKKMQRAGAAAAKVLEWLSPQVQSGVTTDYINTLAHVYIVEELNCIPAPLHYGNPPYPKSICTSVNHVVCHGIPNDRLLKSGDILNVDVTVIKDGFHGDCSKMFLIGECRVRAKNLCRVAQECLYLGIEEVSPGATLRDIARVIEKHAKDHHYSVVREFCGHGIGRGFHESPQVLHYDSPSQEQDLVLEPGMTFTIEPMINLGKADVRVSRQDDWTVTTRDRSLSAQWEHTILVTESGREVLTWRAGEKVVRVT